MDLATFTTPTIKQILKLASLDGDVFEALVLVKRMGTDVREGRRRQFNYIGRLLREVESDLMDALIRAMKDGDLTSFRQFLIQIGLWKMMTKNWTTLSLRQRSVLSSGDVWLRHLARWFEGLINKDVGTAKEVYSIHSVEFDRQMGIVVFSVCGSDLLVMFFCCVDGVYCALMVYIVRTEITEAVMELGDVCTVDD
ncbi:hypothetical protein Syun_009511 [Stephania yunnanensis]|uniref:Uncharacterized protein n=1 Tax=Stephania yunnanensis TaxID=152371 RepID=A0AAP0KH49_9MAGN